MNEELLKELAEKLAGGKKKPTGLFGVTLKNSGLGSSLEASPLSLGNTLPTSAEKPSEAAAIAKGVTADRSAPAGKSGGGGGKGGGGGAGGGALSAMGAGAIESAMNIGLEVWKEKQRQKQERQAWDRALKQQGRQNYSSAMGDWGAGNINQLGQLGQYFNKTLL